MNIYKDFDIEQTEYIKRCQTCWLNVAEGREKRGKECYKFPRFLYSTRKS